MEKKTNVATNVKEITYCPYVGKECSSTNLNGSSCRKKQKNGTCMRLR